MPCSKTASRLHMLPLKRMGAFISSGGTAVVADLDVLEFAYPDLTDVIAGQKNSLLRKHARMPV